MVIPIAKDAGGNRLYLGIADDIRGKIFFFDHEDERRTLVELAPNLKSFLDALLPSGTL